MNVPDLQQNSAVFIVSSHSTFMSTHFYRPRSIAKQGDNVLSSVIRLSVRISTSKCNNPKESDWIP